MRVGFLHSLVRPEEKLLMAEIQRRHDLQLVPIDDRTVEYSILDGTLDVDLVLNRSISQSRALQLVKVYENFGIQCINSSATASICSDKLATSLALRRFNVPQPEVRVAFSEEAALNAIEKAGFPVVLKPAVGSWGRLLAKVNDIDAARSILEHRRVLGNYQHAVFYIQTYIEKRGRDIRSIVVGDECIAASYRESQHWITNAARGGTASRCEVTAEVAEISLAAARAVGSGILGIDLFETDAGYLVNEVNHTMEFKAALGATGVDIPGRIVDYITRQAQETAPAESLLCAGFSS